MGDTFKQFLSEKKKRKTKKRKKSSRKYAVGGGPAVGQGGMGGDLGGDGGGGESFIPTDGSLLSELAISPYARSADILAHTQASTEQQEQKPKPKPRYCERCGTRLRKRDRWCSKCGDKAPDLKPGVEQQEQEVEDDQTDQQALDDPQNNDTGLDQQDDLTTDQISPGDEMDPEEKQDPDKQGIIRTVDDAHLVYKRQTADGDYEELWVYNINTDLKNELEIRRNILAGTDIPQGKTRSDDGSQRYNLVTLGNAQLLHIEGLPN